MQQLQLQPVAGHSNAAVTRAAPADAFGSIIPFAEPYWYGGVFRSPHYTDAHRLFRAKVRAFMDEVGSHQPLRHQ